MKRSALLAAAMCAVRAPGALFMSEVRYAEMTHAIGTGPAPGFKLAASDCAPVSLDDLHGKVLVLAFGLTRCDDMCPAAFRKFM